jgi:hypothetical protein
MSHSYKKVPYCGDHKGKAKKRIANKAVRMWLKENPNVALRNGQYKKLYEKWDICDYYWITTWEEYWKSEWKTYYLFKMLFPNSTTNRKPNKKECYRKWYKYYKRK